MAWGRGLSGQLSVLDKATDRPVRPQPCQASSARSALYFTDRVVQLGAGENYTMVVTLKGDVYGCGTNECGELGEANIAPVGTCKPMLALGGRDVLRVACGVQHVVAVTALGEAFAWGLNRDGQLGLGHQRPPPLRTPQRVALPDDCDEHHNWVDAAAGAAHTLGAVRGADRSAAMTLYAWGDGSAGALGVGDASTRTRPTLIVFAGEAVRSGSRSREVVQFACGARHSLLLCRDHSVLSVGLSADGRLGLPPALSPLSLIHI